MLKNKKILLGIFVIILLLVLPNMVKADNENPTVKTEANSADKSIKVTLSNIELEDSDKEYQFGVSKAKATDPTNWVDLQDVDTNTCTAIITPQNDDMRTILRSNNKCYLFIKEKDSGNKVITTQVDLSLSLENALDITKVDNNFEITYLYAGSSTIKNTGTYYMTAVKIDDKNIIKKYLEAKNANKNTLNEIKDLIDTNIPKASWQTMASYSTFSSASISIKNLIKYEGLYVVWGQVSYEEGRSIYGYTLYDNYPNGYKLPEEDSGSSNKTPSGTNDKTPTTPEKTETQGTTEKKDPTTATSNMPYTGRVILAWIIGIVSISTIVAYVRYKKLYIK